MHLRSTLWAVALSASLPAAAFAQTSPDLSGTWAEASGGRATFSRTDDGSYRVVWTGADGSSVTGRATLDGTQLSVRLENGVGLSERVGDAVGTPSAPVPQGSSGYGYRDSSSDAFERLDLENDGGGAIAGGGELRRLKSGALSTPTSADTYGGRAQIAAVTEQVSGTIGAAASRIPLLGTFASTQPLLDKISLWFAPGLSTKDDVKRLSDYTNDRERAWGRPVTDLAPDALPDMGLFRAEKAAALTRFGRTPSDVTEGFLDAKGSVNGQAIAERQIFWQRWKPIGNPNGKVVVVSPGFQETSAEFLEQANSLNKLGYDVILMDHQWAGHTTGGEPGGIDRGFGVARDVAAVAAEAARIADRDHADVAGHGVILMGNSMGAGPGVLGALALNDAGLIDLQGPKMPRGLDAVLEAPFLQLTPSLVNDAVAIGAHIPLLNGIAMPSAGVPVLSHDSVANAKFANHAATNDVRAQLGAMTAANTDLKFIRGLVDDGRGPTGRLYVIHADQDPLADPAGSRWLVSRLGERGKLDLISANDHVLEESPAEQNHIVDGMKWIDPNDAPAAAVAPSAPPAADPAKVEDPSKTEEPTRTQDPKYRIPPRDQMERNSPLVPNMTMEDLLKRGLSESTHPERTGE
jgi:pimeloyl-ACP methyl ester carboxylesterase